MSHIAKLLKETTNNSSKITINKRTIRFSKKIWAEDKNSKNLILECPK